MQQQQQQRQSSRPSSDSNGSNSQSHRGNINSRSNSSSSASGEIEAPIGLGQRISQNIEMAKKGYVRSFRCFELDVYTVSCSIQNQTSMIVHATKKESGGGGTITMKSIVLLMITTKEMLYHNFWRKRNKHFVSLRYSNTKYSAFVFHFPSYFFLEHCSFPFLNSTFFFRYDIR